MVRLLRYVPGQWCNIKHISSSDIAGIMHLILFFGAAVLSLYYGLIVVLGEGLGLFTVPWDGFGVRLLVYGAEIFAFLILIALAWGLLRRTVTRPARLGPDFEAGTFFFITLSGYILMLGFFTFNGIRFQMGIMPFAGPVSAFFTDAVRSIWRDPTSLARAYHLLWWAQALMMVVFIIYVPFSHHQHALFSPFNIFASSPRPKGRIDSIALNPEYHGVSRPADLTRKQLLELYGCTQCGRCQDACPAQATGKPLSPKKIVQDLRRWMDAHGNLQAPWEGGDEKMAVSEGGISRFISPEEMWSCTTCMACVEACPAFISAADKIVDLRRHAVMLESRITPEVVNFFREVETYGDTFGKGKALREDWILGRDFNLPSKDTDIDVLFWVGCQSTFHERNKVGAVAMFDILKQSGINFSILGRDEMCCGDPLRRMGNEHAFQEMARKNIATLKASRVRKIVAYCPHCYNMIKNEYPQFGGEFEVYHYTEYLRELVKKGALRFQKTAPNKVVYHDPCYLARGNGVFNQPREVLSAVPGTAVLEEAHSRTDTFCCGGGGGHMWIGGSIGTRINEERVRELTAHGAKTIVTSCPYCLVMLEDGVKSLEMEDVKCMDLVEYVREKI